MKPSTIQIQSGDDWFNNNINVVPSFMATIPSLIQSVMRKKSDAIGLIYVDRPKTNINQVSWLRFVLGDEMPLADDFSGTVLAKFTGAKVAGSYVRFGVGDVSPASVVTAINDAITELDLAGESALDPDVVKSIVVPAIGDTTLKNALEKIFDALPAAREGILDSEQIVVLFKQSESSGEITVLKANWTDINAKMSEVDGAEPFLRVTMSAPETAAVSSAVPKLFGE